MSPFKNVNQIPSVTVLYNTFLMAFLSSRAKVNLFSWLSQPYMVGLSPWSTLLHFLAMFLSLIQFLPHWCSHCSFKKPIRFVPSGFVLADVLVSNTFPSCSHNLLPHLLQVCVNTTSSETPFPTTLSTPRSPRPTHSLFSSILCSTTLF